MIIWPPLFLRKWSFAKGTVLQMTKIKGMRENGLFQMTIWMIRLPLFPLQMQICHNCRCLSFLKRIRTGKTKTRIQIRDLHCLLGLVLDLFWSFLGPNLKLSRNSHVNTFQIIWKLFRSLGSSRYFTPARHNFDEPDTFEIIQTLDRSSGLDTLQTIHRFSIVF